MDADVLKYLKSLETLDDDAFKTLETEVISAGRRSQGAQASGAGTWVKGNFVPSTSTSATSSPSTSSPSTSTTTTTTSSSTTNNTIDYDDQNQAGLAAWLESQGLLAGWIDKSDPNWGMYWDNWMLGGGKEGQSIYANDGNESSTDDKSSDSDFALSSLKSAFMSALLETGLDTDTITKLWDWAEGRFTNDSSFTSAQALVEMYDQQAFKDRFPGIAHMRDLPETRRDIPSPAEYLQREGKMKQWFNQYGLDSFAANLDNAVAESFISSVGDAELLERMQTASRLIYEAPEAVKDTFAQWYGPAGDAALMAAFLDPDDQVFGNDWKSLTTLKNQAETAEIGGWSKMYMDLDSPIDEMQAQAIGKLGLQQSQVWSKFGSIKEQENLFLEKQGEIDLDMTTHGVAAEFGVDYDTMSGQELADTLKRRSERRSAEFKGGGGAILSGNRTGLGSAN